MATSIIKNSLHEEVNRRRINVSVPAGETSPWILVASEGMVRVKPGSGGSMKVQITSSPPSIVLSDNINGTNVSIAEDWPVGTVTTVVSQSYKFATAIRFIATTQTGTGDIAT
jgi:hypothetical protein